MDISRVFDPRFGTAKDARDMIAEHIWDRRVCVIFPIDDLFPAQGYSFRELGNYMERRADLNTLEHLHGVDVFGTSEEHDLLTFQEKVADARRRGAVIVMFCKNALDSIILQPKDVLVMYGPEAAKANISQTRHVARLPDFNTACDALAWCRFDLESSRGMSPDHTTAPRVRNINWDDYPDVTLHLYR